MRTVTPGAILLGNQAILPTKEDFRGTIAAMLATQWAADYGVVTREDIHTSRHVAAAQLTADDEPCREWPL